MNELIDFTELEQVMRDLAHDVQEGYKGTLQADNHITARSGKLFKSVRTEVVVGESAYEITMTLEDYWKYLENGTPAHWPPISAILNWISIKPIVPRPDEFGRVPSERSLAFLIARAMAGQSPNQPFLKNPQGGTQASHGLQRTIDAVLPMYQERLSRALSADVGRYIQSVFGG